MLERCHGVLVVWNMNFMTFHMMSSGWCFGTMEFMTFHSVGNVIIPTDFRIFSEGLKPPVMEFWVEGRMICRSVYPLVMSCYVNSLLLKMTIEIVDLPIDSMVDLSIVHWGNITMENHHFSWENSL